VTRRKIKTLKRKGIINTSPDEDLPEDRLKPYPNQRKETSNSVKDIDSEWVCSSCKSTNKKTNKKCLSKKNLN
jgi:rubredoxin